MTQAKQTTPTDTKRPQDAWSVSADLLTTLSVLDRELSEGLKESCGLSLTQFRIMLKLEELGKRSRVRDIAAAIDLKSNTVSSAIAKLEEAGHVERGRLPEDGRAVCVALTRKGKRLIGKVKDELAARFDEAWGDVPDEVSASMDDVMRFIGALVEKQPVETEGAGFSSEYVTTIAESYDTVVGTLKSSVRLPLTEWRALNELDEAGGSLRMSQLTSRLMIPRNTATWITDELERSALVRRAAGDEAANSVYVELTDEGRDTLVAGRAAVDAMCRARLWKGLSNAQLERVFEAASMYADESRRRFTRKQRAF